MLFPRFEHVDARSVARLGEALGHDVRVERTHVRIGDDGGTRAPACVANELARLLEEHRADMHAIRRRAVDIDRIHRKAPIEVADGFGVGHARVPGARCQIDARGR